MTFFVLALLRVTMSILERKTAKVNEPAYVKDFSEYGKIYQILCSPFEWTKEIILVAFEHRILLTKSTLQESLQVTKLAEFGHPARCTCLSLSPNTSLNVVPNEVLFCSGAADYKIRVFQGDLQDKSVCRVLSGHTSYINDVSFNTENKYLASGSDDNTARVWYVGKYNLKLTLHLSSAVVAVAWHAADARKLLVGEKIGLIKFYNVESETPILSLDFAKSLTSVHWCPSESLVLASLQLGEVLFWDLSKPCLPQQSNLVFSENGGQVRFSPHEELYATVNSLEGSLKVFHIKTQTIKLSVSVCLPTNIQWHYHYPLICVGDDSKLCFWKVN
ncbi:nucleoporin Nup37 [Cylas formicarius]|uniref:nucleoporin Nup37 n=1 Tax=Cylas formicarius TaxID=197179 RepID=UPI002958B18D|nr:nucleoporin Nup37 [Cylas formicarius]